MSKIVKIEDFYLKKSPTNIMGEYFDPGEETVLVLDRFATVLVLERFPLTVGSVFGG